MAFELNDQTAFLRPGQLQPGDVIMDPEWGRGILVEEVAPLMIPYWDVMVPVYWIKGNDTLTADRVQTVCLPKFSWRVVTRQQARELADKA